MHLLAFWHNMATYAQFWGMLGGLLSPEQGIKLLGLLLTGSTGQHMASRNGLA